MGCRIITSDITALKKDEKISDAEFLLTEAREWPHKKFEASSEDVRKRINILNKKLGL